jgi:hypothetical protein
MGKARALVLLLLLTMGCAAGTPPSGASASGVPNASTARPHPAPARARPVPAPPEPSAASTPAEPTASPPTQPPKPVARSGGCGFGFSDEADCFGGPPEKPDAVAQDAADIKRSFFELSPVPAVGPLAQATLRRVLPAAFRADHHEELERVQCSGAYLDDEGKWFLLHVMGPAGIDAALAVLDQRGRASFKLRVPNRAQVYLGDVLGNETREIILSRIEGNAVARWPTTWVIYRVDARGQLRRVLEHPKSHSYGSKYEEWVFLNRFDFSVHDQVTVETVLSVRAPGDPPDDFDEYTESAPLQGETKTFVYDPAQGRFRRKRP